MCGRQHAAQTSAPRLCMCFEHAKVCESHKSQLKHSIIWLSRAAIITAFFAVNIPSFHSAGTLFKQKLLDSVNKKTNMNVITNKPPDACLWPGFKRSEDKPMHWTSLTLLSCCDFKEGVAMLPHRVWFHLFNLTPTHNDLQSRQTTEYLSMLKALRTSTRRGHNKNSSQGHPTSLAFNIHFSSRKKRELVRNYQCWGVTKSKRFLVQKQHHKIDHTL